MVTGACSGRAGRGGGGASFSDRGRVQAGRVAAAAERSGPPRETVDRAAAITVWRGQDRRGPAAVPRLRPAPSRSADTVIITVSAAARSADSRTAAGGEK